MSRPVSILALASEFKGLDFLTGAKALGCQVTLLMNERLKGEPWPFEAVDAHYAMPDIRKQPDVTYGVSYLARQQPIDRIVALDDYDVETAAALREHLQLEGMGDSAARRFRDKLAMRVAAQRAGLPVPPFSAVFNNAAVARFLAEVPPPWLLKPRMLAGSEGIHKLTEPEAVWQLLDSLGDRRSYYLIEQFIPGEVYHVDALVWQRQVVFALASRYGLPPMTALQGRGVFSTQVLPQNGELARALLALNAQVIAAMGREWGPTHSEFIRGEDGTLYFLETAARVGGGHIDKLVEAATGLSIWREAARIEVASARGEPYAPPPLTPAYAGLIAAPSRVPYADTSGFTDPEIVYRPRSAEFVSLIVRSSDPARVTALLAEYAVRFRAELMP